MTDWGTKLILWVVAAAVVGATIAIPQPVDPWEFPALTLSRKAVAEDIRRSKALAAAAPEAEDVTRLRTLFVAHGLAEIRPPYLRVDYDKRQAEIHQAIMSIEKAHGNEALVAIRAQAVEDFVAIYAGGRHELEKENEIGAVGGFEQMLEKYGVLFNEVLIAPELTLRAMYKARWNLVHRTTATNGFSEIELQAYWGWLALHGWGVPLQERIEALALYRDAGGANAEEAGALFELLRGRPELAAEELEALYVAEGELRLRNLALGALYAANAVRP